MSPQRLEVLRALDVLDSGPDPDFDRLSRLAARRFSVPVAQVTLVDDRRTWAKASTGPRALHDVRVEDSACPHSLAKLDSTYLVINDLLLDERFTDNPFVHSPNGARFYASAPITVRGQRLGTICILDYAPREVFSSDDCSELVDLAAFAASLFELKDEAKVRARMAAELTREEWRHALTLEAGKVGSWVWDLTTGDISCNDTFRRMFGLKDAGRVSYLQMARAMTADSRREAERALQVAFEDGTDYAMEIRLSDPASWLMARGRVYQRDTDGRPLVIMGTALDITEAKQAAENTRMLLRELNHRVKNTLAMIQSVARQTIRQTADPQRFMDAFSGRLRTLSDTHVLLANRDWSGVMLHEVIAGQLGPDFLHRPDRARVEGPDILLPADHALGLGLILHELVSNAHNHGAWSDEEGIVEFGWTLRTAPEQGLLLVWKETGGPLVTEPGPVGLGTRLIERSLAKVIDSSVKLSYELDGVRATIWLPLPTTPH